MSSIVIEAEFEEMAKREDTSQWKELPLHELRKLYVSDEAKKFLETNIVGKQKGRNHPQDPYGENKEMKLYWMFQESTDVTSNSKKVGHRLKASAAVPANKAALSALGDGLTTVAATSFHGKGSQEAPAEGDGGGKTTRNTSKGDQKKGGGKTKGKNKAGLRLSHVKFTINTNMYNKYIYIYIITFFGFVILRLHTPALETSKYIYHQFLSRIDRGRHQIKLKGMILTQPWRSSILRYDVSPTRLSHRFFKMESVTKFDAT